MEFQEFLIILVSAYILDLIFGDPRWLPHPIRVYGNMISFGEKLLNKGKNRIFKGFLLVISSMILVGSFFFFITKFLEPYPVFYYVFSIVFLFYALANKSLLEEGKAVFDALDKGLEQGRKRLSWIVGRNTEKLNPKQIRTAVFETLSENLSDGVIAPLFYFVLFGVEGAMLYKLVNTFDSMIGYKSEKYFEFGRFAAKLDDVLNFIPARITAIIMLLVTGQINKLGFLFKYSRNHSSPNAGYPESALAAILNCRFGGPNEYHGKIVEKPFIGENDRDIEAKEFKKVSYVNHATTLLFILISILIYYAK
ncbi:adenosylcobinamide-phosphate synthase CbiB [Aureivirga sp. CE67]|uniref:adenosylcobinamide-phosphate synthase CbiB n=1 Tax=Aureivirga sp. CE67 TaxID=1788983 RepID=UPI0018CB1DA7|nr:adenosylcobinamide-phosphate synthase CbiB [Aureivirga sp. CE67]